MTVTRSWPIRRMIATLMVFLSLLTLALTVFLINTYVNHRSRLQQTAFISAQAQAAAASQQINQAFSQVMAIARNLADDLTDGTQEYQDISERLEAEAAAHPDIDGLAVTFQPFVYQPDMRLFQNYIYKERDDTFSILKGATYDYTTPPSDNLEAPQTAWYHGPLEHGAMWNEPFFATGAQRVLIEYGIPFFYQELNSNAQVPGGVVTIDYSLGDVNELMTNLQLGTTGYGYVFSPSGTFLSHPNQELVARATIFDLADSLGDEQLRDGARRALDGESLSYESVDPITNEESLTFLQPIPATQWVLGLTLNKWEFAPDIATTLRDQIAIAVSGGLSVLFGTAILFRAHQGKRPNLWGLTVIYTLVGAIIVGLAWHLAANWSTKTGIQIADRTIADRYLQNFMRPSSTSGELPIQIPTGIFIQAIQFPDPTMVTVNGYIWQRYPRELASGVEEGFMLPGRSGEQGIIEEISRLEQGNNEVITWYFGVSLRQASDATRFPFDSRDITIRIAPRELNAYLILTPDLNAYDFTNPNLRPGLDPEVSINNWKISSSAFSYQTVTYNTDLGLESRFQRSTTPELRFTINSRRNFLGPFIAYLLPALVAAGMIFAYQLSERQPGNDEEIEKTLTFSAALFFVIAITHTALRDNIAAVGITYIEYLYILLYLVIVLTVVNGLMLAKKPQWGIVRLGNNFIIQILYWPVIMTILVVATLAIFVYNG